MPLARRRTLWVARQTVQPIHCYVAAWIASARGTPASRWFNTSSAKWRPCRLSRKHRTDSSGWLVASEMAVIAIGQAASACSFRLPVKPQSFMWRTA